ncbi:MAG TPA: GIY-YIG nuclease family protein [Dongiaceae bacterium]|nr:GIY-YIG nuclease family protein [Dongiaceae bacterium]
MTAAMQRWSVYVVRCRDGSLYTGVTTDLDRRLGQHAGRRGGGAKYLRGRGPLRLVLARVVGSRSLALRLEARLKRLEPARKRALAADPRRLAPILAALRRGR